MVSMPMQSTAGVASRASGTISTCGMGYLLLQARFACCIAVLIGYPRHALHVPLERVRIIDDRLCLSSLEGASPTLR